MSILNRAVLATALLAVAPLASAATGTANMEVSIEITNSCSIEAGAIDFGAVSALTDAADKTSILTVTCSNVGPIDVALGAGASGDIGSRHMVHESGATTGTIAYQLYNDEGVVLGDGSNGTAMFSATSIAGVQTYTVNASIEESGLKPLGNYSDTVVATVSF